MRDYGQVAVPTVTGAYGGAVGKTASETVSRETVADRLCRGLDRHNERLGQASYRLSCLLERLTGPRPEEAQKGLPPCAPGAINAIDAKLGEQEHLIARISEAAELLDALA